MEALTHQPTPVIERTGARPSTYKVIMDEVTSGHLEPERVAAAMIAAQTAAAFLQIEVALYRMGRG